MTTALVPSSGATLIPQAQAIAEQAERLLADANTIEEVTEIRAKVEAARGWAKIHKTIAEARATLLRIEVGALVKIVLLDGAHTLTPGDRKAAEWLASLLPQEVSALMAQGGRATTAAGLCRQVWAEVARQEKQDGARSDGGRFAATARWSNLTDEEADQITRTRKVYGVADILAQIIEGYVEEGEPFTIEDMADELLRFTPCGDDPCVESFRQGVREVCRSAVRKAPTLSIDGTIIPRFITAHAPPVNDRPVGFVRIPTEAATVAHLIDNLAIKSAQLADDAAALAKFEDFVGRVRSLPGADDEDATVGDLLAASISPEVKR